MRKAASGKYNYYAIKDTYIRANVHGAEVIDQPPKGLKFQHIDDAPKHVLFLSTCTEVCKPEGLDTLGRRMLPDASFAYTRAGSLVELVVGSKLEVRKVWSGWRWEECKVSALKTEEYNLAHHPEVGCLAFNSMGRVAKIIKIDKDLMLAHIEHESYPMPFAQLERIVPGSTVRTFPDGEFVKITDYTDKHIITENLAYTYKEVASKKMVFAGDMLAGSSIYKGDPSITKVAYHSGPQQIYGGEWVHYKSGVFIHLKTGKSCVDASTIVNMKTTMPTHSEWMALIKGEPINEEIFIRTNPHSKLADAAISNEIKRNQRDRLKDMLVKFAVDSINEGYYMTARQTLDLLIQGNA